MKNSDWPRMLLEFAYGELFLDLCEEPSFYCKKMFGGLALYVHGLMVAIIADDPDGRTWKGVEYDFPLWDGILVATDRAHHASLMSALSSSRPHPVLGKWLFLPASAESFERDATKLMKLILKADLRVGIEPGKKRKSKSAKAKKTLESKTARQRRSRK